jgi:hypothetical protein
MILRACKRLGGCVDLPYAFVDIFYVRRRPARIWHVSFGFENSPKPVQRRVKERLAQPIGQGFKESVERIEFANRHIG